MISLLIMYKYMDGHLTGERQTRGSERTAIINMEKTIKGKGENMGRCVVCVYIIFINTVNIVYGLASRDTPRLGNRERITLFISFRREKQWLRLCRRLIISCCGANGFQNYGKTRTTARRINNNNG